MTAWQWAVIIQLARLVIKLVEAQTERGVEFYSDDTNLLHEAVYRDETGAPIK